MRVLGVAGTAKNTGKTTTTAAMVNEWPNPTHLAVTSIGYDGESKDNVTGLPKPRLRLPTGVFVVTAEQCLIAGSALLEVLERTDLATPLGRLVVCRVRQGGLTVLAGPNSTDALRTIIPLLAGRGIELLLVDGALGRMAPLAAANGLVLATGAARTRDLDELAREASVIETLLKLPRAEKLEGPICQWGSLLVAQEGEDCARNSVGCMTIEFSGVVDPSPLSRLIELVQAKRLVFQDPVKLLLAGDWARVVSLISKYREGGGKVLVRNTLTLEAVTVNPFFPDFDPVTFQYGSGFIHALALRQAVTRAVSAPVVDVIRQGGARLAKILGFP